MPTILERLEARRAERLTAHDTTQRSIDELLAQANANPDQRDLTADQDTELTDLIAQRDAHLDGTDEDPGLHALDARIAQLRSIADTSAQAAQRIAQIERNGGPRVTVGQGEQIYRRQGDHSFFQDLYRRTFEGDTAAAQRLGRHQSEMLERRDITVSSVAGMVPPVYLIDQYAPIARAGRPFLNALPSQPLGPDGVTFTVPRVTTGTAAAQTAEAAGWNEQNLAVTDLTRTVELTTAQQDLSRTLFMRGGSMLDDWIFRDMLAASEVALDASCLTGNGTTPNHLGILSVGGINAVTYTDVSPTVGEAWPKISDALQRINAARFAGANLFVMHPRRWGWFQAAVDTTGRPLFNFSTTPPPNVVMALGVSNDYGAVVGTLQGVPVVTDSNIPTNLGTNEDIILACRTFDIMFYEDTAMQFTFEQTLTTAPGQVRLAVGRFALFIAGRYPGGVSTIGGTGLILPTF